MILKRLSIQNFRNIESLSLDFSPKINLFVGRNAQGKTNLLEALYLLTLTKSFRAEKEDEMISWGKDFTRLTASADSIKIEVLIKQGGKEFKVNSLTKKGIEVFGVVPQSLFSPEDIGIIGGPPTSRRKFIDVLISLIDKKYLYNLSSYQKILRSRNRVLFLLKEGRRAEIKIWDKGLVDFGSQVWQKRREVLLQLDRLLRGATKDLLGNEIKLVYKPRGVGNLETLNEIKEAYAKLIEKIKDAEIERGFSILGPHRDDFRFVLEQLEDDKILEKDLGLFGSRGERRTALVCLKFCEVNLLEEYLGTRPILILDDVLSELDSIHQELIFSILDKQQTFATALDRNLFPKALLENAKTWVIENGSFNIAS
ncbi:MAG: hypothetical protein A2Y57_01770 [Candidatus Woykebacteria bacterium RBG_13_40_7b]|uniref:DNA replication and repair protein RecF n=1 Tax=Candidatus Woykebacteria bacterium RBG_13_40_7b TaxID=1802594 RepID=A0A1G1WB11_9BACT|nr:MAG: hypothetical protein A2Y57_01770 [Candidatus Woykebacteria bacterium RBG_13_40_7b]